MDGENGVGWGGVERVVGVDEEDGVGWMTGRWDGVGGVDGENGVGGRWDGVGWMSWGGWQKTCWKQPW